MPDAAQDAALDAPDGAPDAEVPDACPAPQEHVAPPLVEVNACGQLSYGRYANRDDDREAHRVPDFSHAGYRGGGVALPDVPVVIAIDPPRGDAHGAIQAAIDQVAARAPDADGVRGAVLLRRGEWSVGQPLIVSASGVVLRGEGQGRDGTRLVFTRLNGDRRRGDFDFIVVRGDANPLRAVGEARRVVDELVPVGARSLRVDGAADLRPGAAVGVRRTPNQRWIDALGVNRLGLEEPWTPERYAITHERRVVAVDGDRLQLDIPIVDAIDRRLGGGELIPIRGEGRVRQVGVEDLRLSSASRGETDEEHGWTAVILSRAEDCWVRRVTVEHFGYAAVSIEDASRFNTVEEVAMLDPHSEITGGRRYAFNVSGGLGNLFQRCYSRNGRHDFVTGSRTTGPNVWLDCYATQSHSDSGPHHRWSTGILLDNVAAAFLHVENRGASGSGHGWSGAQVMFWNGRAEGVRCDAPPHAMSWSVGTTGEVQEGQWVPAEPPSPFWSSRAGPVAPRSLYLKQLEDRLGPAAVARVTTPAQRRGRIWRALAGWAGEGRLDDQLAGAGDPDCATGIPNGATCCAAACGACGGAGCGSRPGGAEACCRGAISDAGRSCLDHPPPCVTDL